MALRRLALLFLILVLAIVSSLGNNYYETLGIPRDASGKDIKKAYRNLAVKWHPDKNPKDQETATKKFQEISTAYEVLSDEKARKRYDAMGNDGFGQGGSGGGFDFKNGKDPFHDFVHRSPQDIFKDFFGTDSPFDKMVDEMFGDAFEQMFNMHQDGGPGRKRSKKSREGGGDGNASPFDGMMGDLGGMMGGMMESALKDMMNGDLASSFSSSRSSSSRGGATFPSSSTTTITSGGKRKTKTVRTFPNGVKATMTTGGSEGGDGDDSTRQHGSGGSSRRSGHRQKREQARKRERAAHREADL